MPEQNETTSTTLDFAPVEAIPSSHGRGRPRGSRVADQLFPISIRDTVKENAGKPFRLTSTGKSGTTGLLNKAFPVGDYGFRFTGRSNPAEGDDKPTFTVYVTYVGTDAPARTHAPKPEPVSEPEPAPTVQHVDVPEWDDSDDFEDSPYDAEGNFVG